jgi:hypothetical protein
LANDNHAQHEVETGGCGSAGHTTPLAHVRSATSQVHGLPESAFFIRKNPDIKKIPIDTSKTRE